MNILIYNPANYSAKDVEALAEAFIKKGESMYLLTQSGRGDLHNNIDNIGGKSFVVKKISRFYYLRQIFFLIKFCRANKIDVVYSNLQQCSIIAIWAQFFIKAKVITWRHHSDSVYLFGNWKEKLFDKLINTFSKKIIVISNYSYNHVKNIEKVPSSKIDLINLGYNFNHFAKPTTFDVEKLKQQYSAKLLLVIVGRLIPLKRVDLAINTLSNLVSSGYDIKLLILGTGILKDDLQRRIIEKKLTDKAILIGHINNVVDYIAASDLLIHTSNSEASCHMPKEAGILSKPVLVCNDVGDFEDYIVDNFNGIFISKENTGAELESKLKDVYEGRIDIEKLGHELRNTIEDRFSIEKIIIQHNNLLKSII
jgi:glycosyltransferase EpsD